MGIDKDYRVQYCPLFIRGCVVRVNSNSKVKLKWGSDKKINVRGDTLKSGEREGREGVEVKMTKGQT